MVEFGKKVVKYKIPIFILSLLLLIPSVFGFLFTRVNYDILSYLPDDIETMKGQDILVNEFGTGAFSFFIVDGMENKDISELKQKIEEVEHVEKVVWYDSVADINIPMEILPDKLNEVFNSGSSTLMAIIYDDTTSSDGTMDAIEEIRSIANKQCFLSGMSAVVTDTKKLSEKETPLYVGIAVLLSIVVLALTMDSYLTPILFLLSIGIAILYNLGTNYFLGEISYITKALSAVLQLGVTMDYSIFLWHSYKEQQEQYPSDKDTAMAHAIAQTVTSIVGSSITTVAGFIALCFMSFTLGMDLGIVMAKGVVCGVICCVTVLPAMILIFDKALEKCSHKPLLPEIPKLSEVVTKFYGVFAIIFLVLLVPAIYGNNHTSVYYNLDETLPKDLESIMANTKLADEFDMNATHMVLVDGSMSAKDSIKLTNDMEAVDGVKWAIGLNSLIGPSIPDEMIPDSIKSILNNGEYQLMLVGSRYKVASDEVNEQVDALDAIIKSYDANGMIVGEAPCTKDLIEITDTDFKVVNTLSIAVIFVIIALVFKSILLPVILVAVIEFAIFINLGIPFYTGTELPFISSIVIGTIQLGATVDYAILMTNRYKKERILGLSKKEAIKIAHLSSAKSIIVSALSFFAATFGVGLYSGIDMISSLCSLMARGALISMVVVLTVLPAMLLIFDRAICATTFGMKQAGKKNVEESVAIKKVV